MTLQERGKAMVVDELLSIIAEQDIQIERLEQDANRYRWLNKYTSQLFMVTEAQMNDEVDRAMAGGVK